MAVMGREATLIKRYASGDGRYFADLGMSCIEMGLSGASLHADNEYVDLDSIEPFKQILLHFITTPVRITATKQAAELSAPLHIA